MTTSTPWMLVAAFALAGGCAASQHRDVAPPYARISEEEARRIALAKVPGEVKSEELERENDRLVYSYDIKQPGKPGVEEVQIDATTGSIVLILHETDDSETKERD
jgi:uncharacterized membrane protein YkoI